MGESNPLFKMIATGELDRFVKEHLLPIDDALIDARAQELIREGESPYNAHGLARGEYIEKQLNAIYPSTRQERTSTAVTTVPSDTYNANFPAPTQIPDSIHMTILPNGKMISRVMNPADAGVSYEQAQSENYGKLKDERELSRKERENELEVKKTRYLYIEEEEHKRALKEVGDTSGYLDCVSDFV